MFSLTCKYFFSNSLYLQENPVSKLVLVSEEGCSGAGVQEVIGGVTSCDIGEEKVSLRVDCQPGRVDGF